MLDGVRYLVVWNPLILMGLHFALHFIGIDRFAEARHKGDREALTLLAKGVGHHHHVAGLHGYNASALNETHVM